PSGRADTRRRGWRPGGNYLGTRVASARATRGKASQRAEARQRDLNVARTMVSRAVKRRVVGSLTRLRRVLFRARRDAGLMMSPMGGGDWGGGAPFSRPAATDI